MSKRTRNRRLSGKVPTDNMDMIENASFDDQENASFGVNNDEEELRKRRRSMKRNKRRQTSIDGTEVSYFDFIEILGDRPISDYTRNDARDYRNTISRLPRNRGKLKDYREKSIKEFLEMNILDSHILNIETQTKLNSRIITIWNFMID